FLLAPRPFAAARDGGVFAAPFVASSVPAVAAGGALAAFFDGLRTAAFGEAFVVRPRAAGVPAASGDALFARPPAAGAAAGFDEAFFARPRAAGVSAGFGEPFAARSRA